MNNILKHEQSKWDQRFLKIAKAYSEMSKDPSTGVGAVIVNNRNVQVSQGFNGYPRGVPDDDSRYVRELKYPKTLHAELNSILFSKEELYGYTIYVYGIFPCATCMGAIIQKGISRVVVAKHSDPEIHKRWKDLNVIAEEMAMHVGLSIEIVEYEGE